MVDFPVAHLKIQNVNVVVVFLGQTFDRKPQAEKLEISTALQLCARGAGIAGNVVPVWDSLEFVTAGGEAPTTPHFFQAH
jgi:hypothetical protein